MRSASHQPADYLIREQPYYRLIGNEIEIFEAAYRNQLPVLLKGPMGRGKTRFLEHMAWWLMHPLITWVLYFSGFDTPQAQRSKGLSFAEVAGVLRNFPKGSPGRKPKLNAGRKRFPACGNCFVPRSTVRQRANCRICTEPRVSRPSIRWRRCR